MESDVIQFRLIIPNSKELSRIPLNCKLCPKSLQMTLIKTLKEVVFSKRLEELLREQGLNVTVADYLGEESVQNALLRLGRPDLMVLDIVDEQVPDTTTYDDGDETVICYLPSKPLV
jgi:hypothetical protein